MHVNSCGGISWNIPHTHKLILLCWCCLHFWRLTAPVPFLYHYIEKICNGNLENISVYIPQKKRENHTGLKSQKRSLVSNFHCPLRTCPCLPRYASSVNLIAWQWRLCWTVCAVLQEAVSTGDPELVQLVLQYRDFRRATERLAGIPELLNKLRQVIHMYTYTLTEDAFDVHSLSKSLFHKLIRNSIGLICHPLQKTF